MSARNVPYTQPNTSHFNDKATDPFALRPNDRVPCKGDVEQGLSTRKPLDKGGAEVMGSGSIFGGYLG